MKRTACSTSRGPPTSFPKPTANDKTIVWGQSQGGQAALFAGELAPSYVPDLDLLGVVSGAPVTDVASMYPAAATIPGTLGFVVMGLIGLQAAYPNAKASDVLTPAAVDQANKLVSTKCYEDVLDAFNKPVDQVIAHNPLDVPGFSELFTQDSTGNVKTAAPMFVYQGLSDDVVYKIFTDKFVKNACAMGDTINYQTFSGKDHYEENDAAQTDILAWMQARLAGTRTDVQLLIPAVRAVASQRAERQARRTDRARGGRSPSARGVGVRGVVPASMSPSTRPTSAPTSIRTRSIPGSAPAKNANAARSIARCTRKPGRIDPDRSAT